ncbi:hypothetical protein BG015_006462 [Linnemannia schmuckeri]|uniref:Uncharacterized protein n=1 Tax=Linnemannia schmuckeri TaxID=64567 RepID=A0A9P5R122_9FUNG|nr:hypothetical protein BG015_006462 [Linnemannia schmuckeri]
MSHGDTNVGGETNSNSIRAASFANAARSPSSASSPNSPLSKYPKKCDTIYQDESLTSGMNLHVRTNSEDTLIFNIPRKVTTEISIITILMDTYDLLSCVTEQYLHYTTFEVRPADPMVYAAIRQHGLKVNDTIYNPITPTPPKLQTYKVNFRRIPQNYKPSDVIQLFSKYGNPMKFGMYYHAHPKRKVYTQEGSQNGKRSICEN